MEAIWRSTDWHTRLGCLTLVTFITVAVLAPVISQYDPTAQPDVLNLSNVPPSLAHPFGTDQYSRDLFARTIYGARVSLGVAVVATIISMIVGSLVGLSAGWGEQWVDNVIMRAVDASMAIPRLVLLIVVLSAWGAVSPLMLAAMLGLTSWFHTSRVVRAEVLSLKTTGFVHASQALGVGRWRLLTRHILPHLSPQLTVTATLTMGNILLIEAGLSFLGLGIPAPGASWGSIIRDGKDVLGTAPWVSAFPGVAIALTVVSFSIVGEHLHQILSPRTSSTANIELS